MSPTRLYSIRRFKAGSWHDANDELMVEEPLQIRLDNRHYKTVMRTPGPTLQDDLLLAQGLLFSDGIVAALEEFERLEHSTHRRDFGDQLVNVVIATLHDDSKLPEELSVRAMPLDKVKLHLDAMRQWPDKMRPHQKLSIRSDSCHAAAILDGNSEMLCCSEDIGQHNAVDKALGYGLENYFIPAAEPLVLLVSGRVGVEIIQKALVARIQTVCSLSAVSSSAVDLAVQNNLNLIGHLSSEELTVYNGDF